MSTTTNQDDREQPPGTPPEVTTALTAHALVRYIERAVDGEAVALARCQNNTDAAVLRILEPQFPDELRRLRAEFSTTLAKLASRPGYQWLPTEYTLGIIGMRVAVCGKVGITAFPRERAARNSRSLHHQRDEEARAERRAERDARRGLQRGGR
ncbi:MAG TPA: hypothetical protein VIJ12_02350 [Candidatus Baltobacteraceae bacterium]